MNELIRLNVGGERYTTTRATLTRYPGSMLGAMFSGALSTSIDEHGCFFIDRDGPMFKHVLNFLRSGRLSLPADFRQLDLLAVEADFYQVEDLIKEITRLRTSAGGSYLEIIEVRVGSTATMPTKNSRDKTILSCRRDIVGMLPREFFVPVTERVIQTSSNGEAASTDFVELELVGSNVRLRLGEHLQCSGWTLVHSDMTSSCGFDSRQTPILIQKSDLLVIEHSFRDRWYLASCNWTK